MRIRTFVFVVLSAIIIGCTPETSLLGGGSGGGSDSGAWTQTITVPADTYWVNSGVYARKGDSITVTATGQWTMWEGSWDFHGPGGRNNYLWGHPQGSLIAQVGLHWNDSAVYIGAGTTFVADRDGILFFVANDGGREDNAGAVEVTIESESDRTVTIDSGAIAGYNYSSVKADRIELRGNHIILNLSTSYVANNLNDAVSTLAEFDEFYTLQRELAGTVPYGGQHVRYYPDPDIGDIGAWGLAGNPIRVIRESGFLDVHDINHSVWGYSHELGHDFSAINGGPHQVGGSLGEAWCNLFNTYALERQGRSEATRWRNYLPQANNHIANGDYSNFAGDPWIPLCMLMELQTTHGWDFYQNFFNAVFSAVNAPSENRPDSERWGWVRDRMNDAADPGVDVSPVLRKYHIPLP